MFIIKIPFFIPVLRLQPEDSLYAHLSAWKAQVWSVAKCQPRMVILQRIMVGILPHGNLTTLYFIPVLSKEQNGRCSEEVSLYTSFWFLLSRNDVKTCARKMQVQVVLLFLNLFFLFLNCSAHMKDPVILVLEHMKDESRNTCEYRQGLRSQYTLQRFQSQQSADSWCPT